MPESWLLGYKTAHNIDLYHFDLHTHESKTRCVELFKRYGTERFFLDDIWDIDWEQFIANDLRTLLPNFKKPTIFHKLYVRILRQYWLTRFANPLYNTLSYKFLGIVKHITKTIK